MVINVSNVLVLYCISNSKRYGTYAPYYRPTDRRFHFVYAVGNRIMTAYKLRSDNAIEYVAVAEPCWQLKHKLHYFPLSKVTECGYYAGNQSICVGDCVTLFIADYSALIVPMTLYILVVGDGGWRLSGRQISES